MAGSWLRGLSTSLAQRRLGPHPQHHMVPPSTVEAPEHCQVQPKNKSKNKGVDEHA